MGGDNFQYKVLILENSKTLTKVYSFDGNEQFKK